MTSLAVFLRPFTDWHMPGICQNVFQKTPKRRLFTGGICMAYATSRINIIMIAIMMGAPGSICLAYASTLLAQLPPGSICLAYASTFWPNYPPCQHMPDICWSYDATGNSHFVITFSQHDVFDPLKEIIIHLEDILAKAIHFLF